MNEVCSEHGKLVSDIEWLKNSVSRVERKVDKLDEKMDEKFEKITICLAKKDKLKTNIWTKYVIPVLLGISILTISVGATSMKCEQQGINIAAQAKEGSK